MRDTRFVFVLALAALWLIAMPMQAQTGVSKRAAAAATGPALVKNCGAMPKLNFAATNGTETTSTTSTSFVNLPPLSVTFSIPGTTVSCVKAELAVDPFATENNQLIDVRVLLDGAFEFFPGEPQLSGDDDEDQDGAWSRAHAVNFYIAGVSPGTHTVTVQWRSAFGGTVFANWRTLGVTHK